MEKVHKTTTSNNFEFGSAMDHIITLVKAKEPFVWVTSYEEERVINEINQTISNKLKKRKIFTWSIYEGIQKIDSATLYEGKPASDDFTGTGDPRKALEKIRDLSLGSSVKGGIFILKDFHIAMSQPVPRMLRDMFRTLQKQSKTLIFVSPSLMHGPQGSRSGLEPTLEKEIHVVPYELPNRDAVKEQTIDFITSVQNSPSAKLLQEKNGVVDYSESDIEKLTMALQGLTYNEINAALTNSLVHLYRLDEKFLLLQKKQIIQRSEILEYIGQTPTMDDVGGLDLAKAYFDTYSDQFSDEAREFGVEPLRGVLFTGVPGTGKSLLAKAVAAQWSLPLLRLDVGKVMTGLVGGSEEKMRAVIDQVEAIAPAILWIDEIEKSLSGTKSSNFSDGGTLSRVFGTLLTAMEERMEGVVTIATANDISALPPELIRRFNELLFVDLPLAEEREEILRIHVNKRNRDIDKLDIDIPAVVKATHLFTGSEIEKCVKEAIARAFRKKKKDIDSEDILGAVGDTKPIAKVMAEKIEAIRNWAKDKARYASSLAAAASAPGKQVITTKDGKELNVSDALDDLDAVMKGSNKPTEQDFQNQKINDILDDDDEPDKKDKDAS